MTKKIVLANQCKTRKDCVDRELVAKIGEAIYRNDEVLAVRIMVKFKDKSSVSFLRDEEEDNLERQIEKMDDEEDK
jgi:hypothetical protein